MSRVYNFSAGPSMLPEEVLKKAAAEMLDYQGSGQSVMDMVHIKYDKDDETELVIRVLGFGPMVEVIEPDGFRNLIIERLKKQKALCVKL